MEKEKGVSGFWYLLGGAAVGATFGVLFAPKKGSETRKDLNEWSLRNRDKARDVLSNVGRYIPARVKGGAKEAVSEGAEKIKHFANS